MNSYERAIEEEAYSKKVVYLFILMMSDFVITYLGINVIGVIEEANPILVWLFEIPFIYGALIRLFYSAFIAWLCMFIFDSRYKYYNAFINTALTINAVVVVIHARWIYLLLSGALY